MTNEEALKILKCRSGWNLSIRDVNALDMAIKALEQESESICKYGVLHKIAEFFQNWNGDETAKMEISVNDMREIADVYGRKARIERQLKEIRQEPCEDAISRAEAQTELEMNACRYTIAKERDGMGQVEWSDQLIKVSDAVDIIRHLSSVTPQEQKTGQWILLDECSNSGYYCSECHKKLVKDGWSNTVKKIKYCPNCGCRMVEPQERSDKE